MIRLCHQFTAELHGDYSLNWNVKNLVSCAAVIPQVLCMYSRKLVKVCWKEHLFIPCGSGLDVSWVWGLVQSEPCWQYVTWFEGSCTVELQIFPCSLSMKPGFIKSERNYIGGSQYSFKMCTRSQDPEIVSKSPVLPVVVTSSRWKSIIDSL